MKGKFVEFVIYSNLLIAFAAAAQILLTYLLLAIPINWDIVLLEGSATLLLYNFSLWLSMPTECGNSPFPRTKWFFKHKSVFWILSIIGAIALLFSLSQLHFYTFLFLLVVGVFSLGYAIPFIPQNGRFVTLRQITGLKVFLIAFVWALSVVGLPVIEFWAQSGSVSWFLVFDWMVLVFLFIIAITLPFDIRDVEQDKSYRLKTLPVLIGIDRSRQLTYWLLLFHLVLVCVFPFSLSFILGLVLTDTVAFFLVQFVFRERKIAFSDVYLLDFLLIIQSLIILMMSLSLQ